MGQLSCDSTASGDTLGHTHMRRSDAVCLLFTLRCVYKYRRPTQRGVHRKRHYRRAAYSVRVHGVPAGRGRRSWWKPVTAVGWLWQYPDVGGDGAACYLPPGYRRQRGSPGPLLCRPPTDSDVKPPAAGEWLLWTAASAVCLLAINPRFGSVRRTSVGPCLQPQPAS